MRPYVSDAQCGCGEQNEMILALQEQVATMQAKLDTIASGAEANVQSDWTATSGDAYIRNKPSFTKTATNSSTVTIPAGQTRTVTIATTAPSGASKIIAIGGISMTGSAYCVVRSYFIASATRIDLTIANVGTASATASVIVYPVWV